MKPTSSKIDLRMSQQEVKLINYWTLQKLKYAEMVLVNANDVFDDAFKVKWMEKLLVYHITFAKMYDDMDMEEYIEIRGKLRKSAMQVWKRYLTVTIKLIDKRMN